MTQGDLAGQHRVHLFVDYQNVHLTAGDCFAPPGTPPRDTLIHPGLLADEIDKARDVAGLPGKIGEIHVYRGRPDPRREPTLGAATDAQAANWARDARVTMRRRALRYPRNWPTLPAREKGVDVMLACDFVRCALGGQADTLILASRDTDLIPALEMVRDLGTVTVEGMAWVGSGRLRFPDRTPLWSTYLDGAAFVASRDRRQY